MMRFQPTQFRHLMFLLLAFALVLGMSVSAAAQSSTNGAIQGTVKDPKGLAVPKAPVTVTNTGTNQAKDATTDDTGVFRVEALPPGTYKVTVEVSGFAKFVSPDVIVEVGRVSNVEVPLSIAGATATVTVTEALPPVNTTSSEYSTNVNSQFIKNLPMNGTRWSNFALLTPAVTPDGGFGLLSFRGISGLLNNNTVDGGNNNQAFFSEEVGRTRLNYSTSPASVREFQVNTSNYSAEYGRAAGGVVNAVTQSGTNRFHGEGFYAIRDQTFNAFNPYSTCLGVPCKPQDRRQKWGGSIGGPAVKDKLFFFFNFDQIRRNFPGVASLTSATSLTLSGPDQTRVTAAGVTPAQQASGLAFLQSITGQVPRQGNQWIVFPKVDFYINSNNHIAFSYNKLVWNSPAGIQTGNVVFRGTHSFGNDFVRSYSYNTHLYSTFAGRFTNDLYFLYGNDNEFETSQTPAPGEPTTGPAGSVPDVFINNVLEFGKPTFLDRRAFPNEHRWEIGDTVAIAAGKHTWKFGADFNHVNDIDDNLFTESGSYSYNNLGDWLIDFAIPTPTAASSGNCSSTNPSNRPCYSSFGQGFGPPKFTFNTLDMAFFAQDDWRVHPGFTLSLGVRWEYEKLPPIQIPNPALPLTSVFPNVKSNWGPRAGFAWDVMGDGKTSLRGGAGMYYGRIINSTIVNAIENTAVSAGQLQFTIKPSQDTTFSGPFYPATFASAPTASANKSSAVQFAAGFQNPLIYEGDVTLERDLGWNTVLSAAWLYTAGRRLPTFIDTNLFLPTTTITYTVSGGPLNGQQFTMPKYVSQAPTTPGCPAAPVGRPNCNFNAITSISSLIRSNYNALAVTLNHRASHNLQFLFSYTYSHAIDDGQASQTFTATNTPLFSPAVAPDTGDANFDLRHRVSAIVVWTPMYFAKDKPAAHAILDNWVITPILTFSTGFNYSGGVSGNAPGGEAGGINGSNGSNRFPFIGRNSFHAPPIKNVDLRVARRFPFTESMNLELFVESFNLFNHTNVTGVISTMFRLSGTTLTYQGPGSSNPFGQATNAGNTLINSRQMQFGARFTF